MTSDFGREITGDLEAAERREWLCTNGLGGYASGTVAASLTRRYHGILVAALRPPLGRRVVAAVRAAARARARAGRHVRSPSRRDVPRDAPRRRDADARGLHRDRAGDR